MATLPDFPNSCVELFVVKWRNRRLSASWPAFSCPRSSPSNGDRVWYLASTLLHPTDTVFFSPALTAMNHHSPNSMPHYSHPQQFLLPQPHSRTQYPYQHSSHSSPLSIDPSFVNATSSHFQHSPPLLQRTATQQYASSPPPATLAPYVLHSPSNHTVHTTSAIPSSSFYGPSETPTPPQPPPPQPLQPTGPTAEQLKEKFLNGLRPLLKADTFTGAGAVSKLTNFISNYGISKVDIPTRLEVLSKIRDNAPNHYFRAWAELAFLGRIPLAVFSLLKPH